MRREAGCRPGDPRGVNAPAQPQQSWTFSPRVPRLPHRFGVLEPGAGAGQGSAGHGSQPLRGCGMDGGLHAGVRCSASASAGCSGTCPAVAAYPRGWGSRSPAVPRPHARPHELPVMPTPFCPCKAPPPAHPCASCFSFTPSIFPASCRPAGGSSFS